MNCQTVLKLILLATGLSACATRPTTYPELLPYVAPASGALAQLQVRSNQVAGAGFLYSFDDQRACKGQRMITNTRLSQNQLKASTGLRADEPASLWFSYLAPGNRTCNIALTFKPATGKNYLAFVNVTELGCAMGVQDISDPLNPKPEPSRFSRVYLPTTIRDNPHCQAADVDAEMAKARKPNLSQLKMDDLKALLPAADKKN